MSEVPVILAHNILRDGVISADSEHSDHPARYAIDGLRSTWWEPTSAAEHYLIIKVANMLDNGDFEISDDGWLLYTSGTGAGSAARNTSNPIDGDADEKISPTNIGTNNYGFCFISERSYRLKANRTYRLSMACKADGSKDLRIGFADGVMQNFDTADKSLTTSVSEQYHDFTPSSDGDYRAFIRPLSTGDFYIDDVHLCEMPDCDTVIFDKGHNLQNYTYQVKKANTTYDPDNADFTVWINWTNIWGNYAIYDPNGNQAAGYKTGPMWKKTIAPVGGLTLSNVQQVPNIFIGKRWELPRNFAGGLDPHASRNAVEIAVGDRGNRYKVKKFSQRAFEAELRNLTPTDYDEIEKFMDYTENGLQPFFLVWRPTSDPTDVLFVELDDHSRNVPYAGGYVRSWNFRALEVPGYREL